MRRVILVAAAVTLTGIVLVLTLLAERIGNESTAPPPSPPMPPAESDASAAASPTSTTPAQRGLLYGRVTDRSGERYVGRLRWGGGEEAFWGDYFNGTKKVNPWVPHLPPEAAPKERRSIEIFGLRLGRRGHPELVRPFMARFGDIDRIDVEGRDLQVTLKSGTVFHLDRMGSDDLGDGVRIWDPQRGTVDLGDWSIRSVELLPTAALDDAPERLHGTVRTRHGSFTGFLQWGREACVGTDELEGHAADGTLLAFPFATLRSVARQSSESALVRLTDERELVLSGTRDVGKNDRGIYVDDPRYGRVLVWWDALVRVDFSDPGSHGSGPGYDDFPPGRPLRGLVTTRDDRRLAGRLVYDLDESETSETLDAPAHGVDYTIPFGAVASIVLPGGGKRNGDNGRASVTLQHGETLELELDGDLGERNAGLLVFVDSGGQPEFVSWSDVARIDFE